MSHLPTIHHVLQPVNREPYQTSDYDRAIQQAAQRERIQSSTPTGTQHRGNRLPGLHDLFASKLLVNPNTTDGQRTPQYEHRRDSVASSDYFDAARRPGFCRTGTDSVIPPPLTIVQPAQRTALPRTSPVSIQSLCSAQDMASRSPTRSPTTSPTTSPSSSLLHPTTLAPSCSLPHPPSLSQPTSPHEVPPAPSGTLDLAPATLDLAPATYVYQAPASAYDGLSYVPGRGPCHAYQGTYGFPPHHHVFQDPLNLSQSKILRKRLSVACSMCRKKKIKCEPGRGGCLQCRKAQRPCKM